MIDKLQIRDFPSFSLSISEKYLFINLLIYPINIKQELLYARTCVLVKDGGNLVLNASERISLPIWNVWSN
jgi:hypothetical protein